MTSSRPERPETITISLPSRLEHLGLLDRITDSISERMEFGEEDRSAIALSVVEAGTNAIQHGSRAEGDFAVDVRFELHPDRLTVTVRDQGPGFPPPPPSEDMTSPEHLLDVRGRGIFIMRSCMDEVEFDFSVGGTVVRLVKLRRPAANGDRPGV